MVKSRRDLEDMLQAKFKTISDVKILREISMNIFMKYNIPIDIISDFISLRTSGSELSEFMLFAVLKEVDENNLSTYFNDEEINMYNETKYKTEKIKFPLKISNMVRVSKDQFIGNTSVKFLMTLRNAQLINYNENSQRTMKKLIKGGDEIYQISLNKAAISSIRELLNTNRFISNTITLNIGEDTDFYYNEDKHELIINEIDSFDILDGYHRYISMSQIYDNDNNFDYPMELRISCFNESKARQFIHQEDQKTKMLKKDSDSFNQYNPGNIVTERISNDSLSDLSGLIGRNDAIIHYQDFAKIVDYFWFKGLNNENKKATIKVAQKQIRDIFNILSDTYGYLLTEKYSNNQIAIVLYTCYAADCSNAIEIYEKLKHCLDSLPTIYNSNGTIRRSVIVNIKNALK